jgi:hypothetical protein
MRDFKWGRACSPLLLISISAVLFPITSVRAAEVSVELFAALARGFVSAEPAKDGPQGIITGNGTMGAIVRAAGQEYACSANPHRGCTCVPCAAQPLSCVIPNAETDAE